MPTDDDFDDLPPIPTGDPIIDRGDALTRLAAAYDRAKSAEVAALLLDYMQKINATISLPPRARLIAFPGGKED